MRRQSIGGGWDGRAAALGQDIGFGGVTRALPAPAVETGHLQRDVWAMLLVTCAAGTLASFFCFFGTRF